MGENRNENSYYAEAFHDPSREGLKISEDDLFSQSGTEMNADLLQKLCIKNQGYAMPELNEQMFLNYRGFHYISPVLSQLYFNLHCLHLDCNGIKKIENLKNLSKLKSLYLQCNCIESFDASELPGSLVVLNLSQNRISTIGDCSHLEKLQLVNLSKNQICKVEGLSGLIGCDSTIQTSTTPDVTAIENKASETNKVEEQGKEVTKAVFTTPPQVVTVSSLTSIDLSHNYIDEENELVEFFKHPRLSQLECLHLQGNPCVRRTKNYRRRIISNLGGINFLDTKQVTKVERVGVEAWMLGGPEEEQRAKKEFYLAEKEKDLRDLEQFRKIQRISNQKLQKRLKRQAEEDALKQNAIDSGSGGNGNSHGEGGNHVNGEGSGTSNIVVGSLKESLKSRGLVETFRGMEQARCEARCEYPEPEKNVEITTSAERGNTLLRVAESTISSSTRPSQPAKFISKFVDIPEEDNTVGDLDDIIRDETPTVPLTSDNIKKLPTTTPLSGLVNAAAAAGISTTLPAIVKENDKNLHDTPSNSRPASRADVGGLDGGITSGNTKDKKRYISETSRTSNEHDISHDHDASSQDSTGYHRAVSESHESVLTSESQSEAHPEWYWNRLRDERLDRLVGQNSLNFKKVLAALQKEFNSSGLTERICRDRYSYLLHGHKLPVLKEEDEEEGEEVPGAAAGPTGTSSGTSGNNSSSSSRNDSSSSSTIQNQQNSTQQNAEEEFDIDAWRDDHDRKKWWIRKLNKMQTVPKTQQPRTGSINNLGTTREPVDATEQTRNNTYEGSNTFNDFHDRPAYAPNTHIDIQSLDDRPTVTEADTISESGYSDSSANTDYTQIFNRFAKNNGPLTSTMNKKPEQQTRRPHAGGERLFKPPNRRSVDMSVGSSSLDGGKVRRRDSMSNLNGIDDRCDDAQDSADMDIVQDSDGCDVDIDDSDIEDITHENFNDNVSRNLSHFRNPSGVIAPADHAKIPKKKDVGMLDELD